MKYRLRLLVASLSPLLYSELAGAQSGTALSQFDPAPAGDSAFGVQSAEVRGSNRLRALLLLDYAKDPLVLSAQARELGAVVSDQLFVHLAGSYALYDRLLVSLDVPVALVQAGDAPSDPASGLSASSPSSAEFGDIRLGARVRVLGPAGEGLHLSLAGNVWLPTGASDSYVSDGGVRGSPYLIFGGYRDRITWSVQTGMMFRPGKTLPGSSATPIGTAFTFGAGFGYLVDSARKLQLGPELYGQTVVAQGGTAFGEHSTNAEVLGSARYRIGDFVLGLGAGPGIGKGAGTPAYRVLGMLAFSPEEQASPPDRDADGVPDAEDACPDVAGPRTDDPRTNGCPAAPPADRDHDSVPDTLDACPDVPGVPNVDPKLNGCPPDADHDGIPDAQDACVNEPGVANADPKLNGCPADSDGDGIPDARDACPRIKGVASNDPKLNGCPADRDKDTVIDAEDACPDLAGVAQPNPKFNGCPRARVMVEEKLIDITQQVQFDLGKATIKPESDPLLQDVTNILLQFPEIQKVEIQGHTDNTGAAYINRKLSKDRAQAVADWLIARGVDKKRLTARGFGPDRPLGDNKTEEGRAKNRRVEFHIIGGMAVQKTIPQGAK